MLNDKQLTKVTGGYEKREKTIIVSIDVSDLKGDIRFTFYIGQKRQEEKTIFIDINPVIEYKVKGTNHTKVLTIYANNILYRKYQIDFINETYQQIC